ncbi:hypothetical protein P3W85_12790 [Cupriavidus basilensis]|uniref:Uncharacterized protein n=1 Tax=Cupriavidus basilensis TaxID=68895 RepID=A0ABT6AN43_9BURK|nr:hypothetical protein [Cupriavidus basilensis]MDF3833818.1 hypothetical protein [Cupriavidus basilensis]
MRRSKAYMRALLLLLIAPVLCALQAGMAAECRPGPGAPPVDTPYNGYQPTGYKGALERDALWFRSVATVRQADASTRYVLKRQSAARRQRYESIEPVMLGGNTFGFAAYRDGCGTLLNADGASLGVAPFNGIETDYPTEGMPERGARFKLSFSDGTDSDYAYVMFVNGRMRAMSPHHYVSSYSYRDVKTSGVIPPHLRIVATASTGALGVLDMATLQEVLMPEWLGIGALSDASVLTPDGHAVTTYLVAAGSAGLRLHTLGGKAIALPRFDQARLVYDWFSSPDERGLPNPAVIETIDTTARTCRIYTVSLKPLLDDAIPLPSRGTCLARSRPAGPYFMFSDKSGKTQVYRKEFAGSEGKLVRTATDVDGEFTYGFRTGVMVLKSTRTGTASYRLVDAQGETLGGMPLSGFRDLGCGFVQVQREGKWWSLREDGQLSPELGYPFSC